MNAFFYSLALEFLLCLACHLNPSVCLENLRRFLEAYATNPLNDRHCCNPNNGSRGILADPVWTGGLDFDF